MMGVMVDTLINALAQMGFGAIAVGAMIWFLWHVVTKALPAQTEAFERQLAVLNATFERNVAAERSLFQDLWRVQREVAEQQFQSHTKLLKEYRDESRKEHQEMLRESREQHEKSMDGLNVGFREMINELGDTRALLGTALGADNIQSIRQQRKHQSQQGQQGGPSRSDGGGSGTRLPKP